MNRLEERVADQLNEKALDAAWEGAKANGGKIKPINVGMPAIDLEDGIRAYLSALEAQGLKIVPVEPTEAMVNASISVYNGAGQAEPAEVYAAMLNAVEG